MEFRYHIHIMTLFPDVVGDMLCESILGRAQERNIIRIDCHQIRDYTLNKQKQVDNYPYGGGHGAVMQADPLYQCWKHLCDEAGEQLHTIYLSPAGKVFKQIDAKRLQQDYKTLILVCGHYEGIDQRFIDECVDEEISMGDFVLTGGEIPAMALTDAVCRLVPGVLSDAECFTDESHWDGLLEYPQYTRPEVYEGKTVPEVLLSGHHKNIESWRREQSIRRTLERRPDLLEDASLTLKEQKFLDSLLKEQGESRLKELEQLVREAVKSDETPGSDREYYQQMKKVKKLLNEKKATLQELKGYYKVLGALKQEI